MTGAAPNGRGPLVAAWLLAALAFAMTAWSARRLPWIHPDAADYAVVARSLVRGEGFTEPLVPFHARVYPSVRHPPELHGVLRPVVLAPLFAVLGTGPFVVRLPALLATALTGVVVFAWGRRAFGTAAGLLGCFLTLANVRLAASGLIGTDDAGFALLFTATAAVLWRALAEERDRLFLAAGLLGALACLEKPSGVLVPLLFLVPAWRARTRPARQVARWLGLLAAPFLVALGLYAVRNVAASGSPAFSFAVLGWLLKAYGYEGMTALYEPPPTLLGVLHGLGPERVAALVRGEMGKFLSALSPMGAWGDALMTPSLLPTLALAGIPLFFRQRPAMVALLVLSVAGGFLLLGVFWHVEPRFLCFLIPLFALWAAGVVALGAGSGRSGSAPRVVRLGALALGVWILIASGASFLRLQGGIRRSPDLNACRVAVTWLAEHTSPTDRIMTFDPWVVAWSADRESVMVPSGGPEAIAAVARRYDAHWLLAHPLGERPRTSQVVMALETASGGLDVTRAHAVGHCRVYRLEWPSG